MQQFRFVGGTVVVLMGMVLVARGASQPATSIGAGSVQVDEAFLDDVRARLVESNRLEDRYFYRERRTEFHTNPFGRLGTGDVQVFEVYSSPVRALTYRRLVEDGGERVSGEDLAQQDREYWERVSDRRQRDAREAAEAASRSPEEAAEAARELVEARERAAERRAAEIEDIVGSLQFVVERREMFQGRPAVVVSFVPHPDARPTTRRGDLARKFAGTLWIDEAAREVSHVEATTVDSISYGLGLAARISDGAVASLTREPIGEGVWLPTRISLEGRGRAMLFLRSLTIDYEVEWFDFHPAEEVPVPQLPIP